VTWATSRRGVVARAVRPVECADDFVDDCDGCDGGCDGCDGGAEVEGEAESAHGLSSSIVVGSDGLGLESGESFGIFGQVRFSRC
jgi:hypothetical protein